MTEVWTETGEAQSHFRSAETLVTTVREIGTTEGEEEGRKAATGLGGTGVMTGTWRGGAGIGHPATLGTDGSRTHA